MAPRLARTLTLITAVTTTVTIAVTTSLLGACHPTPHTAKVAAPARPFANVSGQLSLTQLRNAPLLIASTGQPAEHPTVTFAVMFASWCGHCHVQLDILNRLRLAHPTVAFMGLSYAPFEAFNSNGDLARLRTYVADNAPWLTIYELPEELYQLVGQPRKIPTMWAFNSEGTLLATFDRATRDAPDFAELESLVVAAQPPNQ